MRRQNRRMAVPAAVALPRELPELYNPRRREQSAGVNPVLREETGMLFGRVARDANLLPDADAAYGATYQNHGAINDLCYGCVGEQLQQARKRLMTAERLLRDPTAWKRLQRNYKHYFLTDLGYGEAFNTILATIVLSSNGLNSDVAVKIVPESDETLKGAYGGVKTLEAEIRTKNEQTVKGINAAIKQKLSLKKIRSIGENTMVSAMNDLNELATFRTSQETKKRELTGDILVANSLFDPETIGRYGAIPCVTLIHEATHKYAGTIDYCYFQDDGWTPRTPENKRFGTVWNENEQSRAWAIMNADSVAWFVYNCS
jgi:hypothetical protein